MALVRILVAGVGIAIDTASGGSSSGAILNGPAIARSLSAFSIRPSLL